MVNMQLIKIKIFRDRKKKAKATHLDPRFKETCFFRYHYLNQCSIKSFIIEANNNFNEDFNIQLNKRINQIEVNHNHFCNLSNEQASN